MAYRCENSMEKLTATRSHGAQITNVTEHFAQRYIWFDTHAGTPGSWDLIMPRRRLRSPITSPTCASGCEGVNFMIRFHQLWTAFGIDWRKSRCLQQFKGNRRRVTAWRHQSVNYNLKSKQGNAAKTPLPGMPLKPFSTAAIIRVERSAPVNRWFKDKNQLPGSPGSIL